MRNWGRPPKYDNPEEMREKILEYFEGNEDAITITGLCIHLGFDSRQSFYDYEKRDGFSYLIKSARLLVENYYEKTAQSAKQQTFHIFALKNMGWSDKQEVDHTTGGDKLDTSTKIVFG